MLGIMEKGIENTRPICFNYKRFGYFLRNYTLPPRKGNSEFFKEVILIAKKEESRINLIDNEYDFLFDASIEEPENQELEASGIFMETISEIKSETKNEKSPTYDKEDGAEQQSNVVDFDFFS
nr:hypothetical protein [Tanacetum cinerariifolium]